MKPTLETSRLRLRPCARGDVDDLHRLWTDPDVRRYLWDDIVISREIAASVVESSLASFASNGYGQWIMGLKSDPRDPPALAGFCGMRYVEQVAGVELLYGLHPIHWNQGLASEAARALIGYGFETLKLEKLYCGADPPNTRSFRVIIRLGLEYEREVEINGIRAIYYAMHRDSAKAKELTAPPLTPEP